MSEGSRITVNRMELGNALAFAQLGLSRRPVVPVLGGMRVTISCGTLELAAFDYEITARAKVSGQATAPGGILVTGAELAAAVKSLPKGRKVTARLTITDDALVIECDGITATVAGMGAEATAEYPQLPAMPEVSGYADADAFARSVARVTACAGTDDTLPALLCVQMASEDGEIVMAATDRYRLGVDRLHWTGPDGFAVSTLIPAVTLAKFAAKTDKHGKVALHFAAGSAGFSDGAYSLIARTSDCEFPKYRALIRKASEDKSTVLVHAPALRAAVDRAAKLTGRGERMEFEVAEDSITVRAMRDGQVTGTQVVPAVLDGAALETGFNAGYLASVLGGIEGEALIGFASATKPAQVTADGFTAVIMPIRKP